MSQQFPGFDQPDSQQPYQQSPDPQFPGYQGPTFPPEQEPKKPKWWTSKPAIGIAALIIGIAMGSAGGGGNDTSSAAASATSTATATVTETAPAEPAATVTATATATITQKAKAAAAPKPAAGTTIGEGTFVVGKDIKAGTYSMTVPADSSNCYWQRASDSSGDMDSIIANQNLAPGAHGTVTIQAGEVFTTMGCGTWSQ